MTRPETQPGRKVAMSAKHRKEPDIETAGKEPAGAEPQEAPEPLDEQATLEAEGPREGADLAIVGIGASAGGLQALTEFFGQMPPDSGMAFVVVQHLAPRSQSLLPDLLSRQTTMQVYVAEEDAHVVPNTVYVIPPARDLTIHDGVLHLQQRDGPDELHLPIDLFFRSLAESQGAAGVGMILSGAGADGTLGLRAIKENGGLTIVQEPSSAEQASMPRSAIETGLVDYILPPAEMPDVLLNYAAHLRDEHLVPHVTGVDEVGALQRILTVIRTRTGHDFGLYKRSTVLRRIQRRMLLRQVETLGDYAQLLRRDPEEVHSLFQELLISVTEFFRDRDAFDVLKERALVELLEERAADDPLRVWVPGCATGEEAYSIAILIQESLDARQVRVPVKIFATDVDENAIERARLGRYPHTIAVDVSAHRLERFFVRAEDEYQVVDAIRGMVVFAPQSITKDPPFSHLDLISCRNLLIYMEPDLQRRVLGILEYALKPGGFLFLGSSESLAERSVHFEAVDRKWRIYRRQAGRTDAYILPDLAGLSQIPRGEPSAPGPPQRAATRHAVERLLLENHLPPSLIVDPEGEILFTYGRIGRYLEPVAGQTGPWDVMRVMREGLRVFLVTAIRRAGSEGRAIRDEAFRYDANGHSEYVDVGVTPLRGPGIGDLLLVTFQEPRLTSGLPAERAPEVSPSEREAELENVLESTRQYLQATIEELQSSNEEIRSTNEELQSANEELQTAQEETQSMNEELATVNSQLETKLEELQTVNDDMSNLLTSIDVGIVFLDRNLSIRRFNQAITRIVNLIPGDVGRPIGHISSSLTGVDWIAAAQRVFESLVPHQQEMQDEEGRWYWMRIQPYRTTEDAIGGVVLTFTDITAQKEVEEALRGAQAFAEEVVDTVRQPLLVLDSNLRVQRANRTFYQTFQVQPAVTEGVLVYDLPNHQWDIPRLRELLEEIIPQNTVVEGFEMEYQSQEAGCRRMVLNGRRIAGGDGRPDLILLALEEKE
jgi:two-component system CheB/CheR fusion protein